MHDKPVAPAEAVFGTWNIRICEAELWAQVQRAADYEAGMPATSGLAAACGEIARSTRSGRHFPSRPPCASCCCPTSLRPATLVRAMGRTVRAILSRSFRSGPAAASPPAVINLISFSFAGWGQSEAERVGEFVC